MMKKEVPSYFRYWGKARGEGEDGLECHLLVYHCLDVAAADFTASCRTEIC